MNLTPTSGMQECYIWALIHSKQSNFPFRFTVYMVPKRDFIQTDVVKYSMTLGYSHEHLYVIKKII